MYNTLAALFHRERTDNGQRVDINLFNAALDTQCQGFTVELNIDHDFERSEAGIGQKYLDAPYGLYETADGYIAIAMTPMDQLAETLDLPELAEYEPPQTFTARDEIKRVIENHTREQTSNDLLTAFIEDGIWAAVVNDFEAAAEDPQVQHNEMIIEVEHPQEDSTFYTTGIPGSMSETPSAVERRPPTAGEHTEEILQEVGYDDKKIELLADQGVTEE